MCVIDHFSQMSKIHSEVWDGGGIPIEKLIDVSCWSTHTQMDVTGIVTEASTNSFLFSISFKATGAGAEESECWCGGKSDNMEVSIQNRSRWKQALKICQDGGRQHCCHSSWANLSMMGNLSDGIKISDCKFSPCVKHCSPPPSLYCSYPQGHCLVWYRGTLTN